VRFFRWSFFIFACLFFAFWFGGFVLKQLWSRDTDEFKIQHSGLEFSAKRNEIGVWHVDAPSENALWFALGYLQAHDREFQTELSRHYALGWLSTIFGEKALPKDRLMRQMARVSKQEWDKLPADSLVVRAATAYVAGRKRWLEQNEWTSPVEYKLFQIDRQKIPEWEPWHILALTRLQAWEFSYDVGHELRDMALQAWLGEELSELMSRKSQVRGAEVYAQKNSAPLTKSAARESSRQSLVSLHPAAKLHDEFFAPLGTWNGSNEAGASNAWIIADPASKVAPTLCNDTHLRFSWPAVLYPISYEVPGMVKARGYMLAASPILAIGEVENLKENSKLSWSITLAAFADAQDLVKLEPSTLSKVEKFNEDYIVANPLEGTSKKVSFTEEWTRVGPRVDSIIEFFGYATKDPLALEWIGFERSAPLEFFIRRSLFGPQDLDRDLSEKLSFPAVNFTFIEESSGKTRFGHTLSGELFERDRSFDPVPLPEKMRASRRISKPSARPQLREAYSGEKPFYLVTANQPVYADPRLNDRLASIWIASLRAQSILEQRAKNTFDPRFSQTDFHSKILLKWAQGLDKIDMAKACAGQTNEKTCADLLGRLKDWRGNATLDSWQATLTALWFENFKFELWSFKPFLGQRNIEQLFANWTRSYLAENMVMESLEDPAWRARVEKLSGRSLEAIRLSSLRSSLERLSENHGWKPDEWQWKNFNKMSYAHPFAQLPQPIGDMLLDSMLGPPRSIAGAWDSPGLTHYYWSPTDSLKFPASYGAVMRYCTKPSEKKFEWTMSTGVSGRPFSKWAWPMASEYFFENKYFTQEISP
jgi:penicillin amidase